jgi:3-phosphoshikimate 1-carboxyvinyltransferase
MKIKISNSVLRGDIYIPGSKSHTVRAIIIALMAEGTSTIRNPLVSDDTMSCLHAVKKLGAKFTEITENNVLIWKITGTGGELTNKTDEIINLGNSGTSLRLLTGLVATSNLKISFDGDSSLRGRPMGAMISALKKLKVTIHSSEGGKCPLTVKGPITGGDTIIDGKSSQFVSALLFAAPLAKKNTEITVININEKPYIDMTLGWLDFMGIKYEMEKDYSKFIIKGGQKYKAFDFTIPADFSTATFALLAVAVTGGDINIHNLDFEDKQGDKKAFDYFKKLGLNIEEKLTHIRAYKRWHLIGEANFDLNSTPDTLPALAVASAFAIGKTILSNVSHARFKETDRISAMKAELEKLGAKVIELDDGLEIHSSKLKHTKKELNGYNDHRIIMALAIAGMGLKGKTIINNAKAISVTYPSFIEDFQKLGANIEIIKE